MANDTQVGFGYNLGGIDLWVTAEISTSGRFVPATYLQPAEYPEHEVESMVIVTSHVLPAEQVRLDPEDIYLRQEPPANSSRSVTYRCLADILEELAIENLCMEYDDE